MAKHVKLYEKIIEIGLRYATPFNQKPRCRRRWLWKGKMESIYMDGAGLESSKVGCPHMRRRIAVEYILWICTPEILRFMLVSSHKEQFTQTLSNRVSCMNVRHDHTKR